LPEEPENETTRDAVRLSIYNFLWDEETGLPVELYSEDEVAQKAEEIFKHVYRVYPIIPSLYYENWASA